MALIWDVGNVHNYEDVCFYRATEDDPSRGVKEGDDLVNPVTNAIVWASIQVCLGGITEANAEQWFARLRLIETLFGPMLIRGSTHVGPPEISADEVRAHIGLTVNVTPESDTKWRNRQFKYAMDAHLSVYRRAANAQSTPA